MLCSPAASRDLSSRITNTGSCRRASAWLVRVSSGEAERERERERETVRSVPSECGDTGAVLLDRAVRHHEQQLHELGVARARTAPRAVQERRRGKEHLSNTRPLLRKREAGMGVSRR
jgi:hypothetical protein